MQSYYSKKLEDNNYDFKKWFIEDLVRQFGLTVCLRDEGDLSSENILEALKREDEERLDYLKRRLNAKIEPLASDEELLDFYKKELEEHTEKLGKAVARQARIKHAREKLNRMIENSKNYSDELITNIFHLADVQFTIIEEDAAWSVECHTREIEKYSNPQKCLENAKRYYAENIEAEKVSKEKTLEDISSFVRKADEYKSFIETIDKIMEEENVLS